MSLNFGQAAHSPSQQDSSPFADTLPAIRTLNRQFSRSAGYFEPQHSSCTVNSPTLAGKSPFTLLEQPEIAAMELGGSGRSTARCKRQRHGLGSLEGCFREFGVDKEAELPVFDRLVREVEESELVGITGGLHEPGAREIYRTWVFGLVKTAPDIRRINELRIRDLLKVHDGADTEKLEERLARAWLAWNCLIAKKIRWRLKNEASQRAHTNGQSASQMSEEIPLYEIESRRESEAPRDDDERSEMEENEERDGEDETETEDNDEGCSFSNSDARPARVNTTNGESQRALRSSIAQARPNLPVRNSVPNAPQLSLEPSTQQRTNHKRTPVVEPNEESPEPKWSLPAGRSEDSPSQAPSTVITGSGSCSPLQYK